MNFGTDKSGLLPWAQGFRKRFFIRHPATQAYRAGFCLVMGMREKAQNRAVKLQVLMSLTGSFFYSALLVIMSVSVFFAAGCATVYNPATERKELILIDSAQEVQIGRSMAENIIRREHKLLGDASVQLFANKVGQRIARASDRTEIVYRFAVLDDPDLNAFALPGGYIYIYKGLFDKIDEQGLAAIFAHEVAHVAAKHSVKNMQSALGYNLLVAIALAGFGNKDPGFAQEIANVSGTVYKLLSLGYGREDELFADKLAVKYLRRAGYDPSALVRVFELLNSEKGPGGRVFEVLSTHPRMQERIRRVKEEIDSFKGAGVE